MRQSNREEVFPSAESPPMATTARAVVINTKSQEHHPSVPCHFLQSQEFTPHFWNSHLPFVLPIFFPTSNNLCANSLTASTSTFMATLGPLCFVFTRNRVLWWVLRLSTWDWVARTSSKCPQTQEFRVESPCAKRKKSSQLGHRMRNTACVNPFFFLLPAHSDESHTTGSSELFDFGKSAFWCVHGLLELQQGSALITHSLLYLFFFRPF